MTMVEVMTAGAVIGLITAIAMPQFSAIVSNARTALYLAGVSVVGSVHDGALAAGTKLSIEWEKARAAAQALVTGALLKRDRPERILYHYTNVFAATAIAFSGTMTASDTFSSVMHKGAYATDVSPWEVTMTKKELSFGFYGHANADVSWFVAIEAPDFYSIGAPYDSRVNHYVRAASFPGEAIPVNVIAAGPNPMP